MNLKISGRIQKVLPLATGEGRNGVWRKQEFILETDDQYPKLICIAAWGDKIDENIIKPGNKVTVSIDIESREYNGKWYTDVKAWKIEMAGTAVETNTVSSYNGASMLPPQLDPSSDDGELPF